MASYDAGDCIFVPNSLHALPQNVNQQILGDVVVQMPLAGAIGLRLSTVRKYGAGADGVNAKYHKRMHTDAFPVRTTTTS